jgi:hypothetical protein
MHLAIQQQFIVGAKVFSFAARGLLSAPSLGAHVE